MKLFRYAASLLTLAMLGACSSEEPVVIDDNTDDTNAMYLAINFANTRATDNEDDGNALDGESTIQKVQMFLFNKTSKELYYQTSTSLADGGITGNVAKFTITSGRFQDIEDNWNDLELVVYVNSAFEPKTADDILRGSTGTALYPGGTGTSANNYGFIMSSRGTVAIENHEEGVDGSEDHPWVLKSNVELVRLVSRFDYVEKKNNQYTLTSNKACEMQVSGMDVETFATTTYRVPQFSKNGSPFKEGTTKWAANELEQWTKPATGTWYRMTDVVVANDESLITYGNYQYEIDVLGTGVKYTYARPNTLSTATTTVQKKKTDELNSWTHVPFAVIRAKFNDPKSVSMQNHEAVYASNGVYIGGMKDLIAIKKELGTNEKIDTYTIKNDLPADDTDAKEIIEQLEKNLRSVLKNDRLADNYNSTDEEYIFKLLGAEKYTYNPKLGGYFTYYSEFILDSSESVIQWKYGVGRNKVYKLGVDSFKFLGAPGTKYPGDGPDKVDMSDLYIQLSIKVSDWEVNTLNNNWKL